MSEPSQKPPNPKGSLFARLLRGCLRTALYVFGPLLLLAIGGWLYLGGGRYVTTENAYVKADTVAISTDVDGRVQAVHVAEHQYVDAGELLFELDARPFEIAVAEAEARIGVVRNRVEGYRRTYRQRLEELALAREELAFARREHQRQQQLSQSGIVARSAFDDSRLKQARAEKTIPALREAVAASLAELGGNPKLPVEEHPEFMQALSERDDATLRLGYTRVRSPVAGTVSNLRLQAGEYLEAGDAAFAVVASDSLFIEANLKETQLTHLALGQSARVRVDAFPGAEWQASVASISPATGAEFSVLPPQNATGNWVKVVQRLPVRLAIDEQIAGAGAAALRAGMSLEVRIDTQHVRPVPPALRAAHTRAEAWLNARTTEAAEWLAAQVGTARARDAAIER